MNLQEITYFLAALLFVLALMGGLSLLLKKLGIAGPAMITPAKRRLKVIENMPLDARRRVVLIERDNQQHLILLGQHNDLVIEQNISLDAEDLKNIEQGKERAA